MKSIDDKFMRVVGLMADPLKDVQGNPYKYKCNDRT